MPCPVLVHPDHNFNLKQTTIIIMAGKFVVSLDFELMWGVRDVRTIENYGANILGVHQAIPKMLECFDEFDINATFATVGFLFFKTKSEFLANLPDVLPAYTNKALSPYENNYPDTLGKDYTEDKYHFAPQLIAAIQAENRHEISTHTFCHYYCLEEGQTIESFRADIKKAIAVAKPYNIEIKSIIFPRNQFNEQYLKVLEELGITNYRGCEESWLYKAKDGSSETRLRRALRLADAYINISGYNCYTDEYLKRSFPVNIPSSRFLRPYSPKTRFLDGLRLNRIKTAMTHAAKNNMTYHLWWHPHNVGINQEENFNFLRKILGHYKQLHEKYNFRSITMTDLANEMINER